jgi:hypothetical protein
VFQITELIEHEQRVITGAGVMAVPYAILLLAMGRAHARIHVEHDAAGRSAAMHKVNPLAGQVGKSRKVLICSKPLRLEAAHLTRRSRGALRRFAADNPAHSRIVAQALGVIDILVSGKATEYRLPQQTNQRVAAVPARACIGEHLARHHARPKSVVEFAVGQQPGIRGDNGAAKLQRQAAVEIEPNRFRFRFTHCVRHGRPDRSRISC